MNPSNHYPAAHLIKEIGRGKHGARSLPRAEAAELYTAMLDGRVSDLELGAILMALRIKGESIDELAGFFDAAEASFTRITTPENSYAPIVIPSYNGARSVANLTPLLALLLARTGAPVLIHGISVDVKRVTSVDIFKALELPICTTHNDIQACFTARLPAFISINNLAPKMAHLLSLRDTLGVRNSTHTLVKILQPFDQPALRLCSFTHPEYLDLLTNYLTNWASVQQGAVFLMRGTEGETVANAKRAQEIILIHRNQPRTIVQRQAPVDQLPNLPPRDAISTAKWTESVLKGQMPVPDAILEQVDQCLEVARSLKKD